MKWPAALAVVVVVVAVAVAGLILRASRQAVRPAAAAHPWRLGDFPALQPERVTFTGARETSLAGRFIPGHSPATVVLLHGYGGNQDEVLPIAAALHDAGFSVFTYDQRGCGQSGGTITFGVLEQQDLRSAVDYLTARSDVDAERLGALGFSMGGATTLMEAAWDERLQAVVADSAWADVRHWLRPSLKTSLVHPNAPFSALSLKLVELRTGIDLDTLRTTETIKRISPRPLLLINGTADTIVPASDGELNYAAAGEPKELWLIPGAAHGEMLSTSNPEYDERVVTFFRQALGG
ncbi:MAG TPA: alpha/beta fold hydrolase [Thermomicrobiaceae bacterium]|nr:alpha/beta fold hydrolase [Thermomicrobiaceae bacterium]